MTLQAMPWKPFSGYVDRTHLHAYRLSDGRIVSGRNLTDDDIPFIVEQKYTGF